MALILFGNTQLASNFSFDISPPNVRINPVACRLLQFQFAKAVESIGNIKAVQIHSKAFLQAQQLKTNVYEENILYMLSLLYA